MQPGDAVTFTIGRQTAAGAPSTDKVTADFITAAYLDGVLTSISPAYTEVTTSNGNWREYKLAATMPATAGRLKITVQPSSGFDVISPAMLEDEIEAYDADALANLFLTAQGQPGVLSAADSELGDIVDGDSYKSATLTMPSGKLTPFGQSDLTGLTMEAALMTAPGGTSYPITCTVVSAAARTLTISWDTQQHPSLTTQANAPWYIDIQGIKTGPPKIIVTLARYRFTQVWQRDTRTT